LTPRAGGAPINRLVQSERMIATNNISTQPGEDAGATFWTSVAVVEGRYSAPRAKVVTSDLSATPNPLIAHKTKNLLSPFSNIRAISRKLCMGLSLVIVDPGLESRPLLPRASGSFNPASMRSHAEQRARLKPAPRPHRTLQILIGGPAPIPRRPFGAISVADRPSRNGAWDPDDFSCNDRPGTVPGACDASFRRDH
jgi:hypothetical protein